MRQHRLVWLVWAGLTLAASGVCLGSPLFGRLGYSFSLAVTGPLVLGALHLGVRVGRCRHALGPVERGRLDAQPFGVVLRFYGIAAVLVAGLLALPLVVMALSRLGSPSCGVASGLLWYLVQPVASALFAAAVGVASGMVVRGPRRGVALALALGLVSLGVALGRLYVAPPVFAYDPFWGYFPGSLYDEQVSVGPPLGWARLYHLCGMLALLAGLALFSDGQRRLSWRAVAGRGRLALLALASLGATGYLYAAAPGLGFRQSADDVAQALGGRWVSPHFVVHYRRGTNEETVRRFVEEAEFRYAGLANRLGAGPGRVTIYAFDSIDQKRALTGLGDTSMARPWRAEILVHTLAVPHPVLNHELVHVFAGRLGDRWFGLPFRGLDLASGLVEGVAVALDDDDEDVDGEAEAKLLRDQKLLPPLADLLSVRFLLHPPARAYTAAGSFCRYLVGKYGADKLAELYRAGGTDAAMVRLVGRDGATLEKEWHAWLDAQPVHVIPAERRDILRRPSVFQRRCPHELATRRAVAYGLLGLDTDLGLTALEELCVEDPDRPEHLELAMHEAAARNRPNRAERLAARLLAHPGMTDRMRAVAEETLGDLALRRGAGPLAQPHFAAALSIPADEAIERLRWVKQVASLLPPSPLATTMVKYLYNDGPQLFAATELVREAPSVGLFAYLLARQLDNHAQPAASAEWAERSLALGLPDDRFAVQAQHLAMVGHFWSGDFDRAERACTGLATAHVVGASVWQRRIAFARRYRIDILGSAR